MNVQKKRVYLLRTKDIICLMLVLTGIYLCLSDFMELKIPPVTLFCYIAGIALVLLLLEEKRSWRKYVLAALTVIGFFEIAGSFKEIQQGFLGCLNQVLAVLNQYYDVEFQQIPWEENPLMQDYFFRIFFVGTGSLEGIIWHFSRKKKRFITRLLLPVIFVTGIILMGKTPSFSGVLFLAAGTAVGKLELDYRGAYGALVGIVLILGAASVFANSQRAKTLILKLHDPWQEKQWEIEEAAWDFIQPYLSKEQNTVRQGDVQLGNHKPEQNGRRVFEITLSTAPKESVYLRGFVGGIYKNGNWQAIPEDTFREFTEQAGYEAADYAQWLAKQPYEWAAAISGSPLHLKIEMTEEAAGYMLVPYNSRLLEQPVLSDDGTAYPLQQKEYNWKSYLDEYSSFQETKGLYIADVKSPWGKYQQYVNANYRTVPEGLDQLSEFAKQQVIGKENLPERIPALLAQQAEYSLNLEALPEGSEFAEEFMFRQKKGYCVHFATAGTLLLRMSGIPARYVSGYCVKPEDFKENQDGTYTAAVTDERAHAWSEAFDGRGFYPVEMTPAAATEGVEIPEQKAMPEQKVVPEQKEPKAEEAEKTSEQERLEGSRREAEKKEYPGMSGAIFRYAVRVLILTVLAAGVLIICRRKAMKSRRGRFHQEERSKAVLEIGKEVFRLLGISGFPRERNMTEQAYAQMLQEKIPVEGAQSWQHFVGILQKAAFSGQMLTETEWEETWNLYQMLKERLECTQNKWQKFWRM